MWRATGREYFEFLDKMVEIEQVPSNLITRLGTATMVFWISRSGRNTMDGGVMASCEVVVVLKGECCCLTIADSKCMKIQVKSEIV